MFAVKCDEPLQRIRVVRVEVGESRHHDEVDHLVLVSRMLRADLAVARFVRKRRTGAAALKLLGASDILRRDVARRSARQRAARRGARLETGRAGLEARVSVLRILAGSVRTRARARVGAARGARAGFDVLEARAAAFVPANLHLLVRMLDVTERRAARLKGLAVRASATAGLVRARKKRTADCGAPVRDGIGSADQNRNVACCSRSKISVLVPLRRSSSDGAHRMAVSFLL